MTENRWGAFRIFWKNIKQSALTYFYPFALTLEGEFLGNQKKLDRFFNSVPQKRICQIAAYGSSSCLAAVAALYEDGTVRAIVDYRCPSPRGNRSR